jgi:hypothetical protein
MAQIFKPSANSIAKVSLLLGAALPVVLFLSGSQLTRSSANTKVGVPMEQPIPFSHSHHAFELGIDCRYCHYTVERSSFAGFPSTEVCMSCHSQIWTNSPLLNPVRESLETGQPIIWTKLNKAPEFVYFDHSIHIDRGINCNVCHGPVQKMPLMYKGRAFAMAWCLECHREPEKFLYKDDKHSEMPPSRQVFELYWKYQRNQALTPQEQATLAGEDLPKNSDPHTMKEHAAQMGVKTKQLEDCWTCHR